MDLSIVIPVFNEAASISPLVDEIAAVLGGQADYEIIVVDDGSTDATAERLGACRQQQPRLRVLQHPQRSGQSAAIASGVNAARAPWIVTLDGDGQNDPADIPGLYTAATAVDAPATLWLIAGWRQRRRDSWLKRISSRIANGVRRRLLRDHTPDSGCGLRLFRRDVFLALPQFDHMHRFLPALVLRAGGQVRSLAVNHRPRRSGTSKYGVHNRLWVGLVDLLGVRWLQRRVLRPVVSERE
ncbi:MAG: glycosyltransferase family 2 protein [Gammaproteobacteria bacterium]|nr:glycosyltransferase family 2 protein [Gammaproteobacteria bacterium]MDH3559831.1 glycosyltransferase family 2 protein [Gammaproteobacteria bacterium]